MSRRFGVNQTPSSIDVPILLSTYDDKASDVGLKHGPLLSASLLSAKGIRPLITSKPLASSAQTKGTKRSQWTSLGQQIPAFSHWRFPNAQPPRMCAQNNDVMDARSNGVEATPVVQADLVQARNHIKVRFRFEVVEALQYAALIPPASDFTATLRWNLNGRTR
ncbi:hypothetical protein RRG08_014494 [Elysia crispata]|uniref:Uncharacterized protein n=1 Tax=Elysia crispata TaxID=231223 RepID=A0AAE1AUT7_9GAST|nr:hypothetical protein RRG08_014494 [Elysia crispata]